MKKKWTNLNGDSFYDSAKILRIIKLTLFLLLGILSQNMAVASDAGTNVAAQQATKKISGKVTDASGAGLPGVSIVVKGTTVGVISDADGNYTLSIPSNAKTLVFSFVGMDTQEIVIDSKSKYNVTLEETTTSIGEVVAVGYGTMKKSDVTGSVSSVTPEKLVDRPVTNVGQALQNKIAGVQVIKGSNDISGGVKELCINLS